MLAVDGFHETLMLSTTNITVDEFHERITKLKKTLYDSVQKINDNDLLPPRKSQVYTNEQYGLTLVTLVSNYFRIY